jgi:hypothetical protein
LSSILELWEPDAKSAKSHKACKDEKNATQAQKRREEQSPVCPTGKQVGNALTIKAVKTEAHNLVVYISMYLCQNAQQKWAHESFCTH